MVKEDFEHFPASDTEGVHDVFSELFVVFKVLCGVVLVILDQSGKYLNNHVFEQVWCLF
jgi:hypothetical protein